MKKLTFLMLLLCSFSVAFAQPVQQVEMADALRSSGKIYVVILTICIIFVGLSVYLFSMDRRLKKIEKEN
jgi:CcmD family protein